MCGSTFTGNECADHISRGIDRQYGEGIGIKRRNNCYREIDLENDSKQCGEKELHRIAAGNQAGEQANRYAPCDGAAMKMPKIVMMQPFSEYPDKAVLANGLVRRQVFFKKFSRHEKSVRKYNYGLQTLSPRLA